MRKRILYFDVLNVMACFAVVIMHFNGLVHSFSPTSDWLESLVAECLFYWAVPVFFMLSGANLLAYRKRYSTKVFLIKRFEKTVVPFLGWSIIALFWKLVTNQISGPIGPRTFFNLLLNTQIIDVYWFFIPLFSIYLSIPVLSYLCDGNHDRILEYSVFIGFIFISVLPSLCDFIGINYNSALTLPVVGGNLIFVILGYLLANHELTFNQRVSIYLAGIFGFIVRYSSTAYFSFAQGSLYQVFWGLTNFPCVLLSVAVFVFCKYFKWERIFTTDSSCKLLRTLSSCSFGVYLIHMILFYYLLLITGLDGGRLIWRTAFPFICYFICVLIVLVLKKVPFIKKLVP